MILDGTPTEEQVRAAAEAVARDLFRPGRGESTWEGLSRESRESRIEWYTRTAEAALTAAVRA